MNLAVTIDEMRPPEKGQVGQEKVTTYFLKQTPTQSLLLYDANVIASHNERMVECFKFTASFGGLDCTVVHAEDILENANQLKSRAKEK
jgi:hypothetical protein